MFQHPRIAVPVAFAFSLIVSFASAQNTDGSVQLGLGTDLFAHSSTDIELELGLLNDDVEDTSTTWGLNERSPVYFEMGYGITDGLVVGGLARVGGYSYERDDPDPNLVGDDELTTFELGLFPKIEYMFRAGNAVRPFLGGGLGLLIFNYEENDVDASSTSFGLWGRGGIRYFVSPAVSVDPSLTLSWLTGSGDFDVGAADGDVSATRLGISLGFGISLWI